jgi:hypothetical protein
MESTIYRSTESDRIVARAALTTEHPMSSSGLPVLLVTIRNQEQVYGWCDTLPSGLSVPQFLREIAAGDPTNHAKIDKDGEELLRRAIENTTAMGL